MQAILALKTGDTVRGLRVLQVIPTLDLKAGGPVEGAIQQGQEMANHGHIVDTVTLDLPGSPIDRRVASAGVFQLGPRYSHFAFSPSLRGWLRQNAGTYDVIIIHGMWQYHGFAVWKVAGELGVPYVIFLHGMLDPWFARRYPLKHLKKWLYWPWGQYRIIRDANVVLFTTAEELRLARQSFWLYKARERLVGYGIMARKIAPPLAREAFLAKFPALRGKRNLLYLSRIHPKKGCDLLIKSFAAIASQDPLLHLVLAGPGQTSWVGKLSAMIKAGGLEHRVTFTGMLEGEVKWGAYDAAEVFVLPSHQENFGIVVAEALASGVPVLTTYNVNIWREIQDAHAGIIHEDTQVGCDKLLTEWLALSDEAKAQMRQNASTCFQQNFEIKRVTGMLIDALQFAASRVKSDHTYVGRFADAFKSRGG